MIRRISACLLALMLLCAFTCIAEQSGVRSVHIRAVGDVMSHQLQIKVANQGNGVYDYMPQLEGVRDALGKADYTIANLETTIDMTRDYSSYPRFNTPSAILAALSACGVDMLTLANNHILDGWNDGLISTVAMVEAYGFDHVGAYRTQEEADTPVIAEVNGIKFGFLAYTLNCNGNENNVKCDLKPYSVKFLKNADFESDVRALKEAGAEVIVALPHWGEEMRRSVSTNLRNTAKRMLEAGVDIILGSHPHVVLPIDLVDVPRPDGTIDTCLVAWSMGNFLSNMDNTYVDSGIIVDFTVSLDEQGTCKVSNVGYVPVYVWSTRSLVRLLCTGEHYSKRPEGMSDGDFERMRTSAREINKMIGPDFEMLVN